MTTQIKPDPTKAMYYSGIMHGSQTYNDEVPYTVHLHKVVDVAHRFGLTDAAFICACYLHDTLEDTTASYTDLKKRFGEEVAELVYAVTNELGRNRKERSAKTYPKTRAAGTKAVALKLCDRIANVEYGLADGTGKSGMYAEEFERFVVELYNHEETELHPLWETVARLLDRKTILETERERQSTIFSAIKAARQVEQ